MGKFEQNKKAAAVYNALSFTGRKEYVMCIVGTKREGTRMERLKKTMEKLLEGKKTPMEK